MKRRLFSASLVALPLPFASAEPVFQIAYNETTAYLMPLIKAIYAEMGINPVFQLLPSARAIYYTNSGKCDADMSRVEGIEKIYPHIVETKEPIKKTDLLAFKKRGISITLKNKDELKHYRMGYVLGSRLVEEFLENEHLLAEGVNSVASFNKMLELGRFDIGLMTSTQLATQGADVAARIERIGPVLKSSFSHHVFNIKHADLVPKFDAILKSMKSDGRYARYTKVQ